MLLLGTGTRASDPARAPRFWEPAFYEQKSTLREIAVSSKLHHWHHHDSSTTISRASLLPVFSTTGSLPTMPIPTTLSDESSSSSARQTIMLAATTGGAILLIFVVFAAIFFLMRGRQQRQDLNKKLVREERKRKGAGGVGMLDGEGFDSLRGRPPPQIEFGAPQIEFHLNLRPEPEPAVQEYAERPPLLRCNSQLPFLFPRRASGSGSAFREEVWPPPQEESNFVDPLVHAAVDDLACIVTDVMGTSDAHIHSVPMPVPTSAPSSFPPSLAPAGGLRRNSCSTIYSPTTGRSASTPTLPRSACSTETHGSDTDDDPPWPPTPGLLPDSRPVSYWQRASTPKDPRRERPQLRPSTGDGSPRVMGSSDAHIHSVRMPVPTSAPSSFPATLAPAGRLRRNSCSNIYDSDDDPPWPPTPAVFPPVSYWQRASTPKGPRREPPQLRPSTGDGSPRVKNWLERTPRRPETSTGFPRRPVSAGH
ncbi:hypothetical protein DFH06DRAFT_1324902 [Mycena polygramma]|nr:hypothetical protein DFH06DRAFT_1324902 [Mycena polygramma]